MGLGVTVLVVCVLGDLGSLCILGLASIGGSSALASV